MEVIGLIEKNNGIVSSYNFSDIYQAKYVDEKKTIIIQKILDENDSFYGSNIISVTAIIGKNGVGKTRLLARIINYINRYIYSTESIRPGFKEAESFVLVYRIENTFYNINNNWCEINLENETHLSLKEHTSIPKKDISPIIFLSNSTEQSPRHVNVPSNSKYYFDLSDTTLSKKISGESLQKIKMRKQIDFLQNFKKSIDGINWPDRIYLETELLHDLYRILFGKNFASIKKMIDEPHLDIFLSQLLQSVGINFENDSCSSFYSKASIIYLRNFTLNLGKKEIKKLVGYFENNELTIKNIKLNSNLTEDRIQDIDIVFEKIQKALEKTEYEKDLPNVVVNLEHHLVDLYNELSNSNNLFSNLISAHWEGISAGQYALLNIFSTLFDAKRKISKFGNTNTSEILIIIDEADLYLHPHWQVLFIKILFDVLPEIFISSSIQFIFTTHSPLLLSDLKRSSLILLDENGNVNGYDAINNRGLTFGANIGSIMSSEFFLDGALMGEFAKTKINKVIDQLNRPSQRIENSLYNLEEIKNIIQEVGEPILKVELTRMYDGYVSFQDTKVNEIDSLKTQVNEIMGKIEMLEKRQR